MVRYPVGGGGDSALAEADGAHGARPGDAVLVGEADGVGHQGFARAGGDHFGGDAPDGPDRRLAAVGHGGLRHLGPHRNGIAEAVGAGHGDRRPAVAIHRHERAGRNQHVVVEGGGLDREPADLAGGRRDGRGRPARPPASAGRPRARPPGSGGRRDDPSALRPPSPLRRRDRPRDRAPGRRAAPSPPSPARDPSVPTSARRSPPPGRP